MDKAYYELIKVFDLKSAGFQNESLGACLDEMATKRNTRYILQLSECAEHFTAIWNRTTDFLFFDPETGCYRRTIGDYKSAILGYLRDEYQATSRESVYADHVADD